MRMRWIPITKFISKVGLRRDSAADSAVATLLARPVSDRRPGSM
jgi:hypothetical protein